MDHLLLIENEDKLRETVQEVLQMQGYHVTAACDGSEALAILEASTALPALIISDIDMPGIDGMGLLRHIRNSPTLASVPVLFMTGLHSVDTQRTSLSLGVDDYLVKPFGMADLLLAVSNRLQRQAAVKEAAARDLIVARQRLLTMMAHELRSPLVPLYSGTALLIDTLRDSPNEDVHELLSLIQAGAQRMSRITSQALTLLEIDAGAFAATHQQADSDHDLMALVQDVVPGIRSEIGARASSRRIVFGDEQAVLPVRGYARQLAILVEEPLRNALAYSPAGGSVRITSTRNGRYGRLWIDDDGPGIDPARQSQVWERFAQLDRATHEQQGVGLGLALTAAVAKIVGVTCKLENRPEGGARFELLVPLTTSAAGANGCVQ